MGITTRDFVEDRLPEELKKVLRLVAANWGDVMDDLDDLEALEVIKLSGAMTNEVYQINWPAKNGGVVRKVLVRVYGEGVEVFFNRDDEIRTFEFISKQGKGPRLLGRFPDGRVEEFIHARTLSAADLRDPEISALIAAKMREFHNLAVPGPKSPLIWDRMRNWLCVAKSLCSSHDTQDFCLDTLGMEISMLEKELSQDYQEVRFCHNDLQYGNIMMDEETRSLTLIDYEYASYNPIAYDIVNHFCEMAANYHSQTPHVLDYSQYPDLEERQRFVRIYLSSADLVLALGSLVFLTLVRHHWPDAMLYKTDQGNQPSDAKVEQFVQDVERYTLANHLFWGLWGIISAYVNKINFDYKEYARQRFGQYWLRKPALLGSSGKPQEDI